MFRQPRAHPGGTAHSMMFKLKTDGRDAAPPLVDAPQGTAKPYKHMPDPTITPWQISIGLLHAPHWGRVRLFGFKHIAAMPPAPLSPRKRRSLQRRQGSRKADSPDADAGAAFPGDLMGV
jgi:hypothetical protein